MNKQKILAILLVSLLGTVPHVQAISTLDAPVSIVDQIASSKLLVLVELQQVVDLHEVSLNMIDTDNSTRRFMDIPLTIKQVYKSGDASTSLLTESDQTPLLRVMQSENSSFQDSLVFPIEPGRQAILSLLPDTLVPDAKPAYAVSQHSFHTVDGDMVLLWHAGEVIDKLSLAEFEELVKKDEVRVKEELANAEPSDVRRDMQAAELLERPKD